MLVTEIDSTITTGIRGQIGTVLRKGFCDKDFGGLDLPETDLRKPHGLVRVLRQKVNVIHLAWNYSTDWVNPTKAYSENLAMAKNILDAASRSGVRRVILASSVHADNIRGLRGDPMIRPDRSPSPTCNYGITKVLLEKMGLEFAQKSGLEVVCIRFGAVRPSNKAPLGEEHLWLSNRDCISLIESIIQTPPLTSKFSVFYAVSDNHGRIHDTSNPFGWTPQRGN